MRTIYKITSLRITQSLANSFLGRKESDLIKLIMVTLIFFKEFGSKEADKFRGTYVNPDDPPAEWDYLTRDQNLRKLIRFKIWEYGSISNLPSEYKSKVKKNISLLLSDENSNVISNYGNSKYMADLIKIWILNTISVEQHQPALEIIQEQTNPQIEEKPPVQIPKVPETSDPSKTENVDGNVPELPKENNSIGLITSFAILTTTVIAGFVVLNYLSNKDSYGPSEDENLTEDNGCLLVDKHGRPVDFSSVDWDEEKPPNFFKSIKNKLFGGNTSETEIVKKSNETKLRSLEFEVSEGDL